MLTEVLHCTVRGSDRDSVIDRAKVKVHEYFGPVEFDDDDLFVTIKVERGARHTSADGMWVGEVRAQLNSERAGMH